MAQKNIIQFFGGNGSTKRPISDDVSETMFKMFLQKYCIQVHDWCSFDPCWNGLDS